MLVQILQRIVQEHGWISAEVTRQLAGELNLSRADVHGVVEYYHDFRTEPPGKHIVKICQAEACQAMGSRELGAHAETVLGISMHSSSDDGKHKLEPVDCFGNCACSPAVMVDEKVHGGVASSRLDARTERSLIHI